MVINLKEPKYNARAGEVIAGNLARGGDGKFTRADGSAASGREMVNALIKPPKGGKGKKAGASPAAQDALAEKVGLQKGDSAALQKFAKGGALDSATAQRLADSGLVEVGKDGSVRFSDSGKSVARALARGDERGAADAMSRARDRQAGKQDAESKRSAREAERSARRAESQGRRDAAQAERDKRNADKQAGAQARNEKRNTREVQTVNDRLEEIDALNSSDKNITEPERVRRLNQLDKLEQRLADAGGDEAAQKKLDTLRESLGGTPASAPASPAQPIPFATREASAQALAVFKSGDAWRWLGISSNAYQDRESEIVSLAALDADAERMSASGDYGPLRWWHLGNVDIANPLDFLSVKAGAGADIGTCDFSVMIGRLSLEGGELFHEEIARAIATEPGAWEMSRGFAHPPNEPSDGVYTAIKTFERSLLPKGRAANSLTTFSATKEASSMATIQEKVKSLAEKFFGGDEVKAGEIVAAVSATDKEIAESGLAYKAGDALASPAAETPAAPVEDKAEDMPADGDGGDGESAGFIGDMTADEFIAMLAPALAEALAAAMAPTMNELSATKGALETTQKELAALKTTKEKEARESAGKLSTIDARVKALEGDAPTGARGYRASESGDTASDAAALKAKEVAGGGAPATEADRLAAWAIQ